MADVNITATKRTEFGKGASRRARREGLTPAVLYGHGAEPQHLLLPAKDLFLALRHANALFEIAVEGEKKPVLALPKQVQRHAILPEVEHVDFLLVRAGEKVSVEVPLTQVGEAERGTIVNTELVSLPVLAPATDIPAELEVSIEGLQVGDNVYVSDVKLPQGVEADIDAEAIVLSILAPAVEAPAEGEEAAEGEAAEGAEEE
ncbi:50S ribosomal protein L25/general stress protein Ctc [Tessaracoccus oleiagri]|uniref:Large ribosomal subunit protein bL25 n=1 Tax=Tessaracoccus oleiagri TaxID=686624 RepID=A0A1G9JX51_9ACTN|nr:50S ribosomal protein L25/general stress protein Ctc [Tessaracoccus oleiagri]SDL41744.1 large subunit ribosomal protein L25 [Tessaracoccus oleiagri]